MTVKQAPGGRAPDGATYVTLVDGDGNLSPTTVLAGNANGQATMANSSPVVLASNQSAILTQPQAVATGGASYKHIAAGQATTVVKASAGTLYSIVFNGPAAATNVTTVYDDASGAGTVIAIPLATAVVGPVSLSFGPAGIAFGTGLVIITATANGADMTVTYK